MFQELSISDDTRDISHLLKDNTEYIFLVLEFIQTVRLLQLRETQLKEIVRNLKGCIQDKVKLQIYYLGILFRKCQIICIAAVTAQKTSFSKYHSCQDLTVCFVTSSF